MAFVLRVVFNGIAIWLATVIVPGIDVVGAGTTEREIGILLLIGLVFGLVNAVVKPIVAMVSIPLYVLTLGLFTLVVNALMLMLTAWVTEHASWGLRIDNFGTAVLGALVVSVVSFVLSVLSGRRDRRHR